LKNFYRSFDFILEQNNFDILLYSLDRQVKIQDIIAEQDRVAIPWKLNATHDKESLGVPSSSRLQNKS